MTRAAAAEATYRWEAGPARRPQGIPISHTKKRVNFNSMRATVALLVGAAVALLVGAAGALDDTIMAAGAAASEPAVCTSNPPLLVISRYFLRDCS